MIFLSQRPATLDRLRRYAAESQKWRNAMLGTILIVLVILLLIGALPRWGHSANWGYGPSGILGLILIVVVVLLLLGRL
jgi:hypothetical protein